MPHCPAHAVRHVFRERAFPVLMLAALLAASPTQGASVESDALADSAGGREVYLRHCSRCHQRDGRGVEGLYPGLRDLSAAGGGRNAMIRGLLSGRTGTVDDGAARYDNLMPTHGFLANETIAATLSYVLTEWTDAAAPVTVEQVAAQRLALLSGHPAQDPAAGTSPLADMDAVQYVTTEGPAMSVDEFERARRIFYGRCTGCHGVLRQGTAGNPLTPELMRQRGTEYLMSVISYGSSSGMPNWGTSEQLTGEDINLVARFLQHPVPQPPDMDHYQIRDGWHQQRTPAERPRRPQHDYDPEDMFVVALHDVGEIALLDGPSKTLIARVAVGRAPHRITADASGRYLYVICRDGTASLVDLYASPPERVAWVRVGYEARTLAASRGSPGDRGFVLAGAWWPPQLVLLDGLTLEPLRVLSTRSYSAEGHRYHPEPRVSDITASTAHPEFISHIKETGHVYLFPYSGAGELLQIADLETVPELRAGSFSTDGRYYLTPTDSNAITVLDVQARQIVAEIPARVFGGNPGTAYVSERLGPVWVTTTMTDNALIVVGTDPADHPQHAWRVLQTIEGPASGSLFVTTHPDSPHLWMDTPLNGEAAHSQAVSVYRKDDLAEGYRTLPVGEWSGLTQGPRRVTQPVYSRDGREVWMVVWNPQDQGSAVVVVDDGSLEPVAVIRRRDLITPTRIYSVAALRAEGAAAQAGAPSASGPGVAPGEGATRRGGAGSAEEGDGVPLGAELYAENCANCHGTYGEGDGPVAPSLSLTLNDLRYLSQRNGGEFPGGFVREIIDGRSTRAAHGPADMPVWGAELAAGTSGDADAAAQAKIDALVSFLRAIQH